MSLITNRSAALSCAFACCLVAAACGGETSDAFSNGGTGATSE
jgi:hypothetical protein